MPLQIPHPSTPLHLYRHILRESTYLPPLCRPWIASHVQQRFRDCRYKSPEPYVRQAHSTLRYLRSANAGHIKRLEHICLMATGRIGKRRRILATSQLGREPPADTAQLEEARVQEVGKAAPPEDSSSRPSHAVDATVNGTPAPAQKHDWLDNWALDMVAVLAQSQVCQQTNAWPQTMRRRIDTRHILEGKNSFGRPYRPKLIRNKLKRHWAAVFRQLQPPLPRGEWDHLAALVKGDRNVEELFIPPRRPVARSLQSPVPDSTSEPWDWSQHVLKPARVLERGTSRRQKTLTGREDQDPRGHGRPIGIRVIGPRKLQRIYNRIWLMSPTMQEGTGKKKWSVSWGEDNRHVSAPSNRDLFAFEGVTKDGRVLSSNMKATSREAKK